MSKYKNKHNLIMKVEKWEDVKNYIQPNCKLHKIPFNGEVTKGLFNGVCKLYLTLTNKGVSMMRLSDADLRQIKKVNTDWIHIEHYNPGAFLRIATLRGEANVDAELRRRENGKMLVGDVPKLEMVLNLEDVDIKHDGLESLKKALDANDMTRASEELKIIVDELGSKLGATLGKFLEKTNDHIEKVGAALCDPVKQAVYAVGAEVGKNIAERVKGINKLREEIRDELFITCRQFKPVETKPSVYFRIKGESAEFLFNRILSCGESTKIIFGHLTGGVHMPSVTFRRDDENDLLPWIEVYWNRDIWALLMVRENTKEQEDFNKVECERGDIVLALKKLCKQTTGEWDKKGENIKFVVTGDAYIEMIHIINGRQAILDDWKNSNIEIPEVKYLCPGFATIEWRGWHWRLRIRKEKSFDGADKINKTEAVINKMADTHDYSKGVDVARKESNIAYDGYGEGLRKEDITHMSDAFGYVIEKSFAEKQTRALCSSLRKVLDQICSEVKGEYDYSKNELFFTFDGVRVGLMRHLINELSVMDMRKNMLPKISFGNHNLPDGTTKDTVIVSYPASAFKSPKWLRKAAEAIDSFPYNVKPVELAEEIAHAQALYHLDQIDSRISRQEFRGNIIEKVDSKLTGNPIIVNPSGDVVLANGVKVSGVQLIGGMFFKDGEPIEFNSMGYTTKYPDNRDKLIKDLEYWKGEAEKARKELRELSFINSLKQGVVNETAKKLAEQFAEIRKNTEELQKIVKGK